MNQQLAKHRVVLLGVGHSNAHVVRMWKMQPIPDTELICISNQPFATYSGMLPGVLAGQYSPDQMTIDLVRLCRAVGARLVVDEVTGLDVEQRQVLFSSRPPIPFDLLSIGIGSVPSSDAVQATGNTWVPIKPMQSFLQRLHSRLAQLHESALQRPWRIAIVGGGAGGVEIACCLQEHLRRKWSDNQWTISLFHGGERLMPGMAASTVKRVASALQQKGVQVHRGERVHVVDEEGMELANGQRHPADVVLWATSAAPPALLAHLPLATDDRGFLRTGSSLQCMDQEQIFAVGDVGTIDGAARPKSGVYAVRQGPILWENLRRKIAGEPVLSFRPQRDFLKLLNLGDGTAIGEYWGCSARSRWLWRWKNAIDSRFMKMHQDYALSDMSGDSNQADLPMRCVGCGGKVSGSVLTEVLQSLDVPTRPEVVIGLDQPDDAAVLKMGNDQSSVVTTDFFAAPLNDPYVFGRMSAINALSDIWAMGAAPVAAMTIAEIPYGHPQAQQAYLTELMQGALHEFRNANTALVGGHTIEGPRTTLGFSVVAGQPLDAAWIKGSLTRGDRLVITKPIGTGVLLAAWMQAACRAEWYLPLLDHLVGSNQAAAAIAATHSVSAVTDVTGFGLAGHLYEMLQAAGMSATVDLNAIPVLPGATELWKSGLESTLAPDNRHVESFITPSPADPTDVSVLFDPQTCGGLLMGVATDRQEAVIKELRNVHLEPAVIGSVIARANDHSEIRLV